MMTIRSIAVVGAALLTSSHAHAADNALYEAAKKEGTVVWYTSLIVNQAVRPLVEAFEKKYPGVTVKYARADSGPNAIKVIDEARAGKVVGDVFDGIATAPPLLKAGLVAPFTPSDAGKYPPEMRDPDGRWNALVVYFLTPGINTQLVVIVTWIIAGALACLAGTMLALDVNLRPDLAFNIILPIFAAAIVGGLGNTYGAIAGGMLIGFAEALAVFNWTAVLRPFEAYLPNGWTFPDTLSLVPPEYKLTVAFVILVITLLNRPTGIFKGAST